MTLNNWKNMSIWFSQLFLLKTYTNIFFKLKRKYKSLQVNFPINFRYLYMYVISVEDFTVYKINLDVKY